jgi:ribonucleoside-triphosphate reductase
MNYKKHLSEAKQYVFPEMQEQYAKNKTKKDIYDAFQSLE